MHLLIYTRSVYLDKHYRIASILCGLPYSERERENQWPVKFKYPYYRLEADSAHEFGLTATRSRDIRGRDRLLGRLRRRPKPRAGYRPDFSSGGGTPATSSPRVYFRFWHVAEAYIATASASAGSRSQFVM